MLGYILLAYVGAQIHAPFWYWFIVLFGFVSEVGFWFVDFGEDEDSECE